ERDGGERGQPGEGRGHRRHGAAAGLAGAAEGEHDRPFRAVPRHDGGAARRFRWGGEGAAGRARNGSREPRLRPGGPTVNDSRTVRSQSIGNDRRAQGERLLGAKTRGNAGAVSLHSPGMACRISELVIEAADPERLAAFWSEVLGYTEIERKPGGSIVI